ncbi:MAG: PhzF family phenazine biosynthesis protein, partial [Flavobacteriaceae bacterium]
MFKQKMYQVDAFTDHLFGGNPAAVCVLDQWFEENLMQQIAAENNLSETSFVVKKDNHYEIRWFTPVA